MLLSTPPLWLEWRQLSCSLPRLVVKEEIEKIKFSTTNSISVPPDHHHTTMLQSQWIPIQCCCVVVGQSNQWFIYYLHQIDQSIHHSTVSQRTKQKYIHTYLINLMWLIYFCVILIKLISYSIWSSLNCVTALMINDLLCKILTKLVSLLSSFSHLTFLLSLLFTHMWLAWSMMTYSCYEYMIHYNIRPRVYLSDYDAIKCKQRFVLS